jgi:mannopine transport system substrate-binding protein
VTLRRMIIAAFAASAMGAATFPAAADDVVVATTGGLMRNTLEKLMYRPFAKASGTDIVPFDIEVPDQWARAEGMVRAKKIEFDIVTATGPDLVSHADMLMDIPCSELAHVKEFGLPGACQPKGVARTTGGMVLTYSKKAFAGREPKNWADFWNVKDFPGPRGLPDTGDRDWWVPVVALLADGVPKDKLFPLDLDRAYKKLDEIRPNIAVWWKTGNQVQQIMRDGEIVMTMSYSGRSLATIKDGAPFAMAWDGALRDTGYFAILKGAPNAKGALNFIDYFYGASESHPDFMRAVGYATSSSKGLAGLPEDEQKLYATYPANYAGLVDPDFKWIGDNRSMLRERWTAWLTK